MYKNIVILECCHKKDFVFHGIPYVPIQVGKSLASEDLDFQGDNTGENISAKNKSYCELTALYWAWKNIKDVNYIGLCHYRRYFYFKHPNLFKSTIYTTDTKYIKFIDIPFLERLLKKYDIILPSKVHLQTSVKNDYCINHSRSDYYVLKEAITQLYPEYLNTFINLIENSNHYTPYNMFITNIDIMNQYCQWLFTLLDYVEKHTDISKYDTYQRRIYGFMAERMMYVFCMHNNLKIKHLPTINLLSAKGKNWIHLILHKLRTNICFLLQR